jgi:hypothetical protein
MSTFCALHTTALALDTRAVLPHAAVFAVFIDRAIVSAEGKEARTEWIESTLLCVAASSEAMILVSSIRKVHHTRVQANHPPELTEAPFGSCIRVAFRQVIH